MSKHLLGWLVFAAFVVALSVGVRAFVDTDGLMLKQLAERAYSDLLEEVAKSPVPDTSKWYCGYYANDFGFIDEAAAKTVAMTTLSVIRRHCDPVCLKGEGLSWGLFMKQKERSTTWTYEYWVYDSGPYDTQAAAERACAGIK